MDLTESYYECTSDTISALNNAIGIANGNTATFFPIFVGFFLPLIYLYLKLIGFVHPKEEYSKEEKEEALDSLVTNILRVRDGHSHFTLKNAEFDKLAKVLVKLAAEASQEKGESLETECWEDDKRKEDKHISEVTNFNDLPGDD